MQESNRRRPLTLQFPMLCLPRNPFQATRVSPNSCIDVAKDQDLVISRSVVQMSAQILIENVFDHEICQ